MTKTPVLALCITCAILVAACGESKQPAAHVPPPPTTGAPEPGSASGESPAVTAATAAATAPECKDLEKTDPKTCDPADAVGNPNAK